jgi:hypothetical protein
MPGYQRSNVVRSGTVNLTLLLALCRDPARSGLSISNNLHPQAALENNSKWPLLSYRDGLGAVETPAVMDRIE